MSSCETCAHCLVKVTLEKRTSLKHKFKVAWANQRICFGSVRCRKGMWLKGDGTERTYKSFTSLCRDKNWGMKKGAGCYNYES